MADAGSVLDGRSPLTFWIVFSFRIGIDYEQDDFHFGRHRLHRPPDPGRGGAAGPHRGRPHRQLQRERLEAQARKFRPRLAVLTDEAAAKDLAVRLADTDTKVLGGPEALTEAAVCPEADTVVTAVVGMVGLQPTLAAIRERKRIALANKETLVCAGQLVMDAAEQSGAEIVPVDSEHSAIFQCVQGCADRREIKRLILTCSGGPFYGLTAEEAAKKTKADALRHPNWTMGPKITVDCATLMNKGLEVIEAMRLYRLPLEQVSVVIHRQSIVHSLVEYRDGAILAQLGTPDMRLPIRYAMTYPERAESPSGAPGPADLPAPDLRPAGPGGVPLPAPGGGGGRGGRHRLRHPQRRQRGGGGPLPDGEDRLFRHPRAGGGRPGRRWPCGRTRPWRTSWRRIRRPGGRCWTGRDAISLTGVFP